MHIHFVCSGNVYRSRIGEAYFNSKAPEGMKATSSGIAAIENRLTFGPIVWYAMRIIFNNDLVPFMSFAQQQTTREVLEQADIVVFMQDIHYFYARDILQTEPKKSLVWNIGDVHGQDFSEMSQEDREKTIIETTEKTFSHIKNQVDRLLEDVQK